MESFTCQQDGGEAQSRAMMIFASSTLFGSSGAAWLLMFTTAGLLWKLWVANARIREHAAILEASCAEHEMLRRHSASKVAGSIGSLRGKVDDLEVELDDAHIKVSESNLRIAHLQSRVDDLSRENALGNLRREEMAVSLRSQQISIGSTQADKDQAEEGRKAAAEDRVNALTELAREREASSTLRSENQQLNKMLVQVREELRRRGAEHQRQAQLAMPWRGNAELEHFAGALARGEEGLNDAVLVRIAELLVQELAKHSADSQERMRSQRQLLTCLHPDKWPAGRIATRLMQEVQRTPSWVAHGQLGGS